MNKELRKILGSYATANTMEKEITDYIWNSLYDELFMPVYERIVEQITKGLEAIPPNERTTSRDIIKKLELQQAIKDFSLKMQKRVG